VVKKDLRPSIGSTRNRGAKRDMGPIPKRNSIWGGCQQHSKPAFSNGLRATRFRTATRNKSRKTRRDIRDAGERSETYESLSIYNKIAKES